MKTIIYNATIENDYVSRVESKLSVLFGNDLMRI